MVAKKTPGNKPTVEKLSSTKTHPTKQPAVASSDDVPRPPMKKSSRMAWIALGVFVALCVTLALFLSRPEVDYTYNNYPFTKATCPGTDTFCYFAELKIDSEQYAIQFYHHPSDVENIIFEYAALESLRDARAQSNATVIIGVPDGAPGQLAIAGSQLGRVLGKRYGILDFTVVQMVIGTGIDKADCDDARKNTVVIAFQQGAENAITSPSPNCIVLTATSPEETIKVADAFVYRIFGIIRTVREIAPTPLPPLALNTSNVTR